MLGELLFQLGCETNVTSAYLHIHSGQTGRRVNPPILASIAASFDWPAPRLRFSPGSLGSSKLHTIRLGSLPEAGPRFASALVPG